MSSILVKIFDKYQYNGRISPQKEVVFILRIDNSEVKGRYIVLSKEKAHFFSKKVFGLLFKFRDEFFILDQDEWNFIVERITKENKNKEKRAIERIIASRTFKVKLKSRRRILIPKKFRKD